jgi:hypothetical protein
MPEAKLTAAQDQMVDLLVARHRLGEPFWPIDNRLRRTANILEQKGYIEIYPGHVEGTFRASLTAEAERKFLSNSIYKSPLERQLAKKIADKLEKKGGDPTTIRMIRKHWED